MKYAVGILNWIKGNPVLAFLLIAAFTYSLVRIFEAKKSCQDCSPYEKIAQDLLNAMLKEKETAFEPVQSSYHYAVYLQDTTKPMTKEQWGKYRDSVIRVNQKKLDSLKQKKS